MNVLHLVQTSSQDTRVFQQQVWSLLLGTLGWPVYRSQPFLQNALAAQRAIECVIPLDIWRLLWLPLSQLSMVSPNIWIQLIHIQKKSQRHILRYRYHTWHTAKLRLSASGLLPRLQKSPQSRDARELSPENFHWAKSNMEARECHVFSLKQFRVLDQNPHIQHFFEGKKGNKMKSKGNGKIDIKKNPRKIEFDLKKVVGSRYFVLLIPQVKFLYNVSPDSCCHLFYKYQVRRYEYTQNE